MISTRVRRELEQALGHSMTEAQLTALDEDGFVEPIANGTPGAISRAVAHVRAARQVWSEPPRRSVKIVRPPAKTSVAAENDWNEAAFSKVLAAHARRSPHKESNKATIGLGELHRLKLAVFRAGILKGDLIDPADVGDWILTKAAEQDREKPRTGALVYRVGPDAGEAHEPTHRGAALDQLRDVAHALADFYGWYESDAVDFALTDRTPVRSTIRAVINTYEQLPARARIELSIDPKMTPAEVAQFYRLARKTGFGSRRLRRLSQKHCELATWAPRIEDNEDIVTLLKEWNTHAERLGKAWRYDDQNRFKRDAQKAYERLTSL